MEPCHNCHNRLSNRAINKDVIGPGCWWYIHSIAIKADSSQNPNDKNLFLNIIYHIRDSFPCDTCRKGFTQFILNNPPSLADNLFKWSYAAHVDASPGNKPPPFDDMKSLYSHH